MRRVFFLVVLGLMVTLLIGSACGGDEGGGGEPTPFVSITADDETPGATDAADNPGDGATPEGDDSDSGDEDGDGDSQGLPADFDVCTLLTMEEITGVIGVAVDDGEAFDSPPFYDCQYFTDAGGIDVQLFAGTRDDVEFYFEIGHESDEKVDDVADGAYWDDDLNSLEVLSGNYTVAISSAGTGEVSLEQAIDLAKAAIEHLP